MARLTAKQRNDLPAAQFAGPGRTFPIPDESHAIAAERLVGRSQKAGNISASTAASIKAKAKAKLSTGHPSERISKGSGRDHYSPKR
jgi:hypothetical protein